MGHPASLIYSKNQFVVRSSGDHSTNPSKDGTWFFWAIFIIFILCWFAETIRCNGLCVPPAGNSA